MNLWGHRFSQNASQKFEGFLPYPLINFQSRNCFHSWKFRGKSKAIWIGTSSKNWNQSWPRTKSQWNNKLIILRNFFDKRAKQIRSKQLIENKEKYGLIWFDLESISRPIDKLRVKAKTLCENQLTEIKTEHGLRNQEAGGRSTPLPLPTFW